MAKNKLSDRRKYVPDGSNEYTTPKEKPPRYDLRRKHKIKDDPLSDKDNKKDDEMKTSEKDIELVKKVARKRLKEAGENKYTKDSSGFEATREGLEGFAFKEKGLNTIANTYKNLASAFYHMVKASNLFSKCKSSQVSPDGKLGGKGYVQPIRGIRNSFSESINVMSELLDTFYDEVNSPYWKKQTYEDNPIVKDILSDADKLIDRAEDIEEDAAKTENQFSDM